MRVRLPALREMRQGGSHARNIQAAGLALAAGALALGLAGCATESAPVSDPSKGDNTQLAYTGAESADEQSFDTVTFGSYQGQDITWLGACRGERQDAAHQRVGAGCRCPYDNTAEPYHVCGCSRRAPRRTCNGRTSSIRTWLNGEFLNAAFSADEKGAIAATDARRYEEQRVPYGGHGGGPFGACGRRDD